MKVFNQQLIKRAKNIKNSFKNTDVSKKKIKKKNQKRALAYLKPPGLRFCMIFSQTALKQLYVKVLYDIQAYLKGKIFKLKDLGKVYGKHLFAPFNFHCLRILFFCFCRLFL